MAAFHPDKIACWLRRAKVTGKTGAIGLMEEGRLLWSIRTGMKAHTSWWFQDRNRFSLTDMVHRLMMMMTLTGGENLMLGTLRSWYSLTCLALLSQ